MDFLAGHGGSTREELAERLLLPDSWVTTALDLLCAGHFFIATTRDGEAADPPRYLPARPPSAIAVIEILNAVREAADDARGVQQPAAPIVSLLARQKRAERAALDDLTLEALAAEDARS
jgi:hypothetical protein